MMRLVLGHIASPHKIHNRFNQEKNIRKIQNQDHSTKYQTSTSSNSDDPQTQEKSEKLPQPRSA